jgi:hypothetical protein
MTAGFSDTESLVWLTRLRQCVNCGYTFSEQNNIGHWKCKRFHPMGRYATNGDTTYRCCKRAVGSPGCVPADHTDSDAPDQEQRAIDAQTVSCFQAAGVSVCKQSWTKSSAGTYIIDRVDPDAMERYASGEQAAIDANIPAIEKNLKVLW